MQNIKDIIEYIYGCLVNNKKIEIRYKKDIEILGKHIFIYNKNEFNEINHDSNLLKNITLKFTGKNSLIIMCGIPVVARLDLTIGENSFVFIGKNFSVRHNMFINISGENCFLCIGDNGNWGSGTILMTDENNLEVVIGNEFLSATNTYIRASDGHVIFDLNDKSKAINSSQYGIHIGNHVWIGHNVTILKDVFIPEDCIVAACSVVVKKHFVKNSVIGGIPARIIRGNVSWNSKSMAKWPE